MSWFTPKLAPPQPPLSWQNERKQYNNNNNNKYNNNINHRNNFTITTSDTCRTMSSCPSHSVLPSLVSHPFNKFNKTILISNRFISTTSVEQPVSSSSPFITRSKRQAVVILPNRSLGQNINRNDSNNCVGDVGCEPSTIVNG
eukprot:Tbor_TRINITY_DN5449_c1_g4::TRINITY_DN5449_c1_g4_i2::g.24233::m.24233